MTILIPDNTAKIDTLLEMLSWLDLQLETLERADDASQLPSDDYNIPFDTSTLAPGAVVDEAVRALERLAREGNKLLDSIEKFSESRITDAIEKLDEGVGRLALLETALSPENTTARVAVAMTRVDERLNALRRQQAEILKKLEEPIEQLATTIDNAKEPLVIKMRSIFEELEAFGGAVDAAVVDLESVAERVRKNVAKGKASIDSFSRDIVEGVISSAISALEEAVESLQVMLEEVMSRIGEEGIEKITELTRDLISEGLLGIFRESVQLLGDVLDDCLEEILGQSQDSEAKAQEISSQLDIAEPISETMTNEVDRVRNLAAAVGVPI